MNSEGSVLSLSSFIGLSAEGNEEEEEVFSYMNEYFPVNYIKNVRVFFFQ
jgi:hypothetical protein